MLMMKNNIFKLWKEYLSPFLRDPLFLSRWILPYHNEDEGGRVSVRVGSGSYRWIAHNYTGALFMFVQDMYQGIMPFSHIRNDGSQFAARLEPENGDLERLIANSLNRQSYRHFLSDAISKFIRDATHSLFIYGRLAYEIVCETDADGKIIKFEFVDIYPLSVKMIFGRFFQIIPWWVAKNSHVRVGVHKIPKQKILYIEFPKSLGGRKKLKKILRRLATLSKYLFPEFQLKAIEKNQNIGFDLDQYIREKDIERGQLTRQFGWNQRKFPDNEILEYYLWFRHLNFALSQVIIREHILDKVNDILNGSLLNLDVEIVLENVLTSEQIKSEFDLLKRGDLEFRELYKRTS